MASIGMALDEWRGRALKRVDERRAAAILEGIDMINWIELDHAHGDADDVPAMLRALLTEDELAIDAVWQELHETIWHQGTVYTATVAAVPFLQRMLAAGEPPKQYDVLMFLQTLAESSMPKQVTPELAHYYEQKRKSWAEQGLDFDGYLKQRHVVEQSLYKVLRDGVPVYKQFVGGSNDEVRTVACELVSTVENSCSE